MFLDIERMRIDNEPRLSRRETLLLFANYISYTCMYIYIYFFLHVSTRNGIANVDPTDKTKFFYARPRRGILEDHSSALSEAAKLRRRVDEEP